MKIAQRHSRNSEVLIAALLVFVVVCLTGGSSNTQLVHQAAPIVAVASVPFYPPAARVAHIEGIVRLRVSTDGKKVSAIAVESGPPMLASATEQNIRTWSFKEAEPTRFEATFRYKMLPQASCDLDDGLVKLQLPTNVEVDASPWQTCDPSATQEPKRD